MYVSTRLYVHIYFGLILFFTRELFQEHRTSIGYLTPCISKLDGGGGLIFRYGSTGCGKCTRKLHRHYKYSRNKRARRRRILNVSGCEYVNERAFFKVVQDYVRVCVMQVYRRRNPQITIGRLAATSRKLRRQIFRGQIGELNTRETSDAVAAT